MTEKQNASITVAAVMFIVTWPAIVVAVALIGDRLYDILEILRRHS